MLNSPIAPIDLSGGYRDVSALLQLLIDPVQTKQRLDELVAQENAAKEQIAALNEMAADTRRLNSAAKAIEIVGNNRKTALDAREAELDERAKRLEQNEGRLSAASLQKRENLVAAREQAALLEADRLAVMRADLEGKHAKIKNLSATL
jgi:seryl-tRNA synthetase